MSVLQTVARCGKSVLRADIMFARSDDEDSVPSDDETFEPDSLNNRRTHRCVISFGGKSKEGLEQDRLRLNKEEARLQRKLKKKNITQAERKRVKAQYERFKRKKERNRRMAKSIEASKEIAKDPTEFKQGIEAGEPGGFTVGTWTRAETGESEERDAKRFVRHHQQQMDLIRRYARLPDIGSTERFLRKNFRLVCDNTILCMQFQLTDMIMKDHPDHKMWTRQIVFMSLIINYARKMKKDPQDASVLPLYFKERKKTMGKNFERNAYVAEHTSLMARVWIRIQMKKEEQKKEEEESANKKELKQLEVKRRQLESNAIRKELHRRSRLAHIHLIEEMMKPTFPSHIPQMHPNHMVTQRQIRIQRSPGGFCPVDVLRYIPEDMRDAFRDQDILRQQKLLWNNRRRIEPHLANAIMSGMWKPTTDGALYCLVNEAYKWYGYAEEPCLRRQLRRKNDSEPDDLIQNLGCEGRSLVFDREDIYNYPGQVLQNYCELTKEIIDMPLVKLNFNYVFLDDEGNDVYEIHAKINKSSTMEEMDKAIAAGMMSDKRDEDTPSWQKKGYKSLEDADENRIEDIKDTIQMIEDAQNTPNTRIPEIINESGECTTKALMKAPPTFYSSLMNSVEGSKLPQLGMAKEEFRTKVDAMLSDKKSDYNSVGHGHQELRLACPAMIDGVPVKDGVKGWCKCPDLRCEKPLPNQSSLMPRDHSKIWHTNEFTAEQLVDLFMTPVADPTIDENNARIGRMMRNIQPDYFEDGIKMYLCMGVATDGFSIKFKPEYAATYRAMRPKRKSKSTLHCKRYVVLSHTYVDRNGETTPYFLTKTEGKLKITEFYSDDEEETLPMRALKISHLRHNCRIVQLKDDDGLASIKDPSRAVDSGAKEEAESTGGDGSSKNAKPAEDPVSSSDPAEEQTTTCTGLVRTEESDVKEDGTSHLSYADFDEVD